MTDVGEAVRRHYGGADITTRILEALKGAGVDTAHLSAEMLFPIDQFHGRELVATQDHVARLALRPDMRVLDVGSGIGGPARYMAATYGCRVTGIDMTEVFVGAARALSALCGLEGKLDFVEGDALDMPFEDATFDAATCLYVVMNIPDPATLCREIRRVLKPAARLVISGVCQGSAGPPIYPLPWSEDETASFLTTPDALRTAIAGAGFTISEWTDETSVFLDFVMKMREAQSRGTGPRLTNAVVLGERLLPALQNFGRNLVEGRLVPVVAVAEAS